jgi:hypothetical protein
MHRTIVITFATLDGIIEDPDGSQGTPNGGWAFRHGPETVASDKFKLGPILDTGILLSGERPGSCSPTSGPTAPTSSQPP